MRFLVNEKSYEHPVAAGLLRYAQDGIATGTKEQWRMTRTDRDDLIVRVDLDARGNGNRSYLYHWIEDKNGLLQRLVYRHFGDGKRVSGSILFEDGRFINSRVVAGERVENVVSADALLFPSTTGLALLARQFVGGKVALLANVEGEVKLIGVEMDVLREDDVEVQVGRKQRQVQTHTLSWQNQTRTVRHQHGYPLGVHRPDNLTASATQFILY